MFHQLKKFACGGLIGTVCHYITLWGMVGYSVAPMIASSCGMIVGATVVYFTNYYITFSCTRTHTDAMKRFFPLVITGFCLNALILSGVMTYLSFPLLLAQLLGTAGQFLFGFFMSRMWVF